MRLIVHCGLFRDDCEAVQLPFIYCLDCRWLQPLTVNSEAFSSSAAALFISQFQFVCEILSALNFIQKQAHDHSATAECSQYLIAYSIQKAYIHLYSASGMKLYRSRHAIRGRHLQKLHPEVCQALMDCDSSFCHFCDPPLATCTSLWQDDSPMFPHIKWPPAGCSAALADCYCTPGL